MMESPDPNPASSFPENDWHRRLFQFAPDALLVTRLRDGHIVDMNSRFLETMGYSREELVGRTTPGSRILGVPGRPRGPDDPPAGGSGPLLRL